MGIVHRMNRLRELFQLRLGPGAVVLPNDVKKLHLEFAFKLNDGHFGARKVWRLYLPRLKYHNPTVSMTVNRTTDQLGPATMTITFAEPTKSPVSTNVAQGDVCKSERTEIINMKHKHESEILKQLIEATGAVEVRPTKEEEEDLRRMEEERVRSAQDRARSRSDLDSRRREEELLAQARSATI